MSPNESTVAQVTGFRAALTIAVGFVAVLLVTAGAKGYRDLESVRNREAVLQGRIASSESEIERLERRLELLRSDPDTLERLAREELRMVRPGEKVIVLGELSRGPSNLLGGLALEAVEIDVDEPGEVVD